VFGGTRGAVRAVCARNAWRGVRAGRLFFGGYFQYRHY